MEDNITEKFALLNLIKALQGLSAPADGQKENFDPPFPAPSAPTPAHSDTPEVKVDGYNAMANILERHEVIANRVRNKK